MVQFQVDHKSLTVMASKLVPGQIFALSEPRYCKEKNQGVDRTLFEGEWIQKFILSLHEKQLWHLLWS